MPVVLHLTDPDPSEMSPYATLLWKLGQIMGDTSKKLSEAQKIVDSTSDVTQLSLAAARVSALKGVINQLWPIAALAKQVTPAPEWRKDFDAIPKLPKQHGLSPLVMVVRWGSVSTEEGEVPWLESMRYSVHHNRLSGSHTSWHLDAPQLIAWREIEFDPGDFKSE